MRIDIKKALLTGTAIVAVSTFAVQARAAAITPASGTNHVTAGTTWDIQGHVGATDANLVYDAGAGALTVTSGGAQATADAGTITLTDDGGTHALTVGNGLHALVLTINGDVSGNVATNANDLSILITADDAGGGAGTASGVTFKGNVDLGSSAITLKDDATTAGATVATATFAGTGTQTISGGIAGFGAGQGVVNVTNTGGTVTFNNTVGGTTAVGAINVGGGNGTTANVVFAGTVGTATTLGTDTGIITLGQTNGGAVNVTFQNTVAAGGGIVVGTGATAVTNTITFDASGASFGVTGAITGGNSAEVNNLVVNSGVLTKTVTLSSAVGADGNIDSVTVNANSKLITGSTLQTSAGVSLLSGSAFTAGGAVTSAVAIGSGATYTIGSGANGLNSTGAVTGSGTLTLAGNSANTTGQTVTGNVGTSGQSLAVVNANLDNTDGGGTVTDTHTITGNLYTNSLVFGAASTPNGGSIGATLVLSSAAGVTTANIGTITTGVAGDGNLTLNPAGANNITATIGEVGTSSTNGLRNIVLGNNGAQAGTVTANFTGDIFASAITLGKASGGTLTALNLNGGTQTVSATISGITAAGNGAVSVGNTTASNVTFTGAIGGGTAIGSLKTFAGSTSNLSQNVTTTASGGGVTGFDNEGTTNIDSTGNTVTVAETAGKIVLNGTTNVVGANNVVITGSGGGGVFTADGTISTVLSGTTKKLTLGSGGAAATTIGGNSNTTIQAGNQIILNGTGTTTLGSGTTALNATTVTLNIDQTADFIPSNAYAVVDATAGAVNIGGSTGSLIVGVSGNSTALTNGQIIKVIDSSAAVQANTVGTDYGTLIGSGRVVLQSTGLVTISNHTSTAQDLIVEADFVNPNTVLANSANANIATALENFPTATGNVATIRGNLPAAPTAAAANDIAEAAGPTVDGGNTMAAISVTDSAFDITDARIADARLGNDETTGMAAGNTASGMKAWLQGFGQHSSQDDRDGVRGYDANTYGGAAGLDSANILDNALVGVSVAYGRSNVNSNNANSTDTDIDSYQISLYGSQKFKGPSIFSNNNFFVDGMVGYAFDRNDTTRHDVGGIAGLTADGTYDANQIAVRVSAGQDYTYMGATLTPSILGDYLYYNADSYTETGAGNANLHVNQDSFNQLDLGVALKAGWAFKNTDGSWLKPDVHVGYKYDVLDDKVDANSSFTAGGPAFSTEGLKPGRNVFNAGADLKFVSTTNWEFSGSYDFEAKSQYTSHTGLLRAGYKF